MRLSSILFTYKPVTEQDRSLTIPSLLEHEQSAFSSACIQIPKIRDTDKHLHATNKNNILSSIRKTIIQTSERRDAVFSKTFLLVLSMVES